jgi:hypothetical protein
MEIRLAKQFAKNARRLLVIGRNRFEYVGNLPKKPQSQSLGIGLRSPRSRPRNQKPQRPVTLLGMVTLLRLVEPLNALFPMLVTLLGMVAFVRLVHE